MSGLRTVEAGKFLQVLRPGLAGQGARLTGALLLTLLLTALELLRPWPIQYLFDHVLLARSGIGVPLLLCCGAVALLGLAVGQATVVRATLLARIGRKVATRLRRTLFHHLHRLALPFHLSRRTGDLLMRLMGDVNMVRDIAFLAWLNLVQRAVVFLGAIGIMLLLDPALAGLALLPLVLLVFGMLRSSRELAGVTRKQRRKQGDAAAYAAESLHQIRLIKSFAAEERVTRIFARHARSGEKAGGKAARIAAGMTRLAEVCIGLGLAMVLLVGALRVLAGALTPGELLVVVSYTRALYKPVRKVAREGSRLARAAACLTRVQEVLAIEPEDDDIGGPVPAFEGDIRFRDVRFCYTGGVPALRNLSFRIEAGHLAVITGANGSGKSTVLGLLLRLFEPDEGGIYVDGLDIATLGLNEYRTRLSYVPQDTLLFGVTVRDNIRFGNLCATDEQIEAAARLAAAHDFIAERPAGYETVLGENGETLSGGQARRLMLARAAVRDARILVLDEPLTGLDPAARSLVAEAIRRVASGRTTLVVHHGSPAELGADLHLHLHDGRLASPEEAEVAGVS